MLRSVVATLRPRSSPRYASRPATTSMSVAISPPWSAPRMLARSGRVGISIASSTPSTSASRRPSVARKWSRRRSRSAGSSTGSAVKAQRLARASLHGELDLRPQLLGRVLLEQVQLVVVTQVEDRRHQAGADPVALAQVVVDDHAHAGGS